MRVPRRCSAVALRLSAVCSGLREGQMRLAQPTLTVYFDGSCPLCRAEIGLNSAQTGADRIRFQDVAAAGEKFAEPLGVDPTEEQALARFHLRLADGTLVSGAAAFVQIWMQLPAWRRAARLASLPGVMPLCSRHIACFSRSGPCCRALSVPSWFGAAAHDGARPQYDPDPWRSADASALEPCCR